jgi:hypothetical protein
MDWLPNMLAPLPHVPSDNYGARILACIALGLAISCALWLYDAVAHRDPPYPTYVLPVANYATDSQPQSRSPDMTSPAVAYANADVPMAIPSAMATKQIDRPLNRTATAKVVKTAAMKIRKPVRIAKKRQSAEGREVYAQAPAFNFSPFGRF